MWMSKKKIVLIVFAVIAALFLISFLNFYAYYPARNLLITSDSSSEPLGALQAFNLSGDICLFPDSLHLTFTISIWNDNPGDCWMEEADYAIFMSDTQVLEGRLQSVNLPANSRTSLPDIPLDLSLGEVAEVNPELITYALLRNGNANFKISINVKTPALLLGILRIGTAETSDDLWESIHVVDSLTVSSFNWHSGGLIARQCHPGEDLLGQFRVTASGGAAASLEAKITEVALDGEETVIAEQELEGGLTSRYQTVNVSWHVPDSPPMDCVGFSVHLLCGGIEVWSAPVDPPFLQLVRRYSLGEALEEDFIDLVLKGTGYCAGDAVKIEVEVSLEVSVDLEVEAGTVLTNSGSGQNMIVGQTTTVRVEPKLELELKIEAYCLDLYKDNPNSSEIFTVPIGSTGYSEDAIRLMQSLEDAPYEYKSLYGVQIALWAIIEDPLKSEVQRVFSVSESSLEDAAWLLRNIGIDPNQKQIFSGS